jgi:hypothetical protein
MTAIEKLVLAGDQASFSVEQMIQILQTGQRRGTPVRDRMALVPARHSAPLKSLGYVIFTVRSFRERTPGRIR